MAKSQKRSSREVKKPKMIKKIVAPASPYTAPPSKKKAAPRPPE